jgi:hypothetical protein
MVSQVGPIEAGQMPLRALIEACERTLNETYRDDEDVEEVLARAEKRLFAILEQQENVDTVSIDDILEQTFQRIFERMDQEDTGGPPGQRHLTPDPGDLRARYPPVLRRPVGRDLPCPRRTTTRPDRQGA